VKVKKEIDNVDQWVSVYQKECDREFVLSIAQKNNNKLDFFYKKNKLEII